MTEKDLEQIRRAGLAARREEIERGHACAVVAALAQNLQGYEQFRVEYDHIRYHRYGEMFFGWTSLN